MQRKRDDDDEGFELIMHRRKKRVPVQSLLARHFAAGISPTQHSCPINDTVESDLTFTPVEIRSNTTAQAVEEVFCCLG